jgi:hypothetical protein
MIKKLFYLKLMFLTLLSVQMNAQETLDQQQPLQAFGENANLNNPVYETTAFYQTFQAGISGLLTKVDLAIQTGLTTNTFVISITATDSNGAPTGPDLSSTTVTNSLSYTTILFNNPTLVLAGTKYAIKVSLTSQLFIYGKIDATTNPYPNGKVYRTTTTNSTPVEYNVNQDILFKTYVDPIIIDNPTITNYTGCSGVNDGSVALTPTNGTAPYSYAWTSTVAGFTSPGNVSSISNLTPGAYTCVITDASTPTAKTRTYNYTIVDNGPIRDAYILNNATCGTYGLTINPLATPLYQNSFDTSTGITLSGDAVREASNQIKLVPDQNNKNGKVIINNLPAILPADFEVNWRFFHLQKDGADGYSFNLGNDSFPGAFEDGTNQGLAVKFKIYQQDQVSIKWNGAEIVAPVNTTLELGRWQDAKLTVVAGEVTLYVNGKLIASNVTIPSFAQNNAYKIIFAARTGGASNETIIDDVTLGDLSTFEYSIDGTTFQTANTFSNITLPTNRTLPVWLKQNGCSRKIRDYVFTSVEPIGINVTSSPVCNPTAINVEIPASLLANAEFYSNDFSTKNGYTFGGSATKTTNGILLTKNESDNKGYLIVNKPEAFDKNGFKFTITHKTATTNGADGFSINLGDITPIVNFTVDPENGVISGLAVRFKTFGTDNLQVYYNNTQLTMAGLPSITIETGNTETYSVIVKDNMVKVYQGTTEKFSATLPAAYATDDFPNHQFVVAARTGGSANENLISSVKINNAQTLQASLDNTTFTDVPDGATTALPLLPSQIVENKTKVYFKVKDGCSFTTFKEIPAYIIAAAPVAPTVQVVENTTRYSDLLATAAPGYEIRWYFNEGQLNANAYGTSVSATSDTYINTAFTEAWAVQYPIGNTTCISPFKKVFFTNATTSNNILTQIGNEGDAPNAVTSVVTTTQLSQILPAITGVVTNNGYLYQGYIDNNPNLFSSPATASEVQTMVNAVNAQVVSNTVLTQIGNEGDDPNTVTSVVTVAQLGVILPAITGIVAANEAAYQAYIDANPNLFSSPLATPAEVQAMVTAVNATLSTDSFDATTKIVVYPNPSNGMFTIEMDQNATIELYDVVGKQLKTQKITVGTSQLDLTDYNSGMYFAKVTNELNQTKTVRLIKQ